MYGEGSSSGSGRDDFRGELLREFLVRAVGAAAIAEVDLPHIVVCRDDETGAVSYSGPFPNALAALVFAERESALDLALNDGPPMRFLAAALYSTPAAGPD